MTSKFTIPIFYHRFRKEDIHRLKCVLNIPHIITCKNGSRVDGLESLCIMLARFAYPCRYGDLVQMFGRDVPLLCVVTMHMMDHIYENFHHLLATMDQPWLSPENLLAYADAVHEKGGSTRQLLGLC